MARILHIISGISYGGAERSLLSLVQRSRHEHMVLVISSHLDQQDKFLKAGAKVLCLQLGNGLPSPLRILRVCREVKVWRPMLINAWMPHAFFGSILLKSLLFLHVPLVWCVRGSLAALATQSRFLRLLISLGAHFSAKVEVIVYNSARVQAEHQQRGYHPQNEIVIHNGVDERMLEQAQKQKLTREELEVTGRGPIIGSITRAHPVKGVDLLLEAFSMLPPSLEANLLLIGNGLSADNEPLAKEIAQYGLTGRVHLMGVRDDRLRLASCFHLFVLPSRSESFPNALLEVASLGVPVVATDVGAVREMLEGLGELVPPNDVEALSAAMLRSLEDNYEQRVECAKSGGMLIRERYSMSAFIESFDRVYDDTLTGKDL